MLQQIADIVNAPHAPGVRPESNPAAEQLLADIGDAYESLSRQLKVIARYVEQHRDHIGLDRIQ